MNANQQFQSNRRKRFALLSILVMISLLAVAVPVILAQSDEPLGADLTQSHKLVDSAEALPGGVLKYSIVLQNSGNQPSDVLITDTLPVGLSYEDGSFSADGDRGNFSINGNVINWSDSLSAKEQLTLRFQAAISDSMPINSILTNTVQIAGIGDVFTRTAATSVISETHTYLPVTHETVPIPSLALLERVNANNEWTISWYVEGIGDLAAEFEIQEDITPAFANPQSSIVTSPTTTMQFSHPVYWISGYYYRVRLILPGVIGGWSNVLVVGSNYHDWFDDPNSGWTMRREDTDEIDNSTYYSDGKFVHRMKSRWDFLISGPLMPAPTPPYRIESRIRLVGMDNLHTYGLIFGADWNGSTCPDAKFTSCFNQYYRLMVTWFGNNSRLKYQLKAIKYHDPGNGHARGPVLIDYKEVHVNSPSQNWQNWAVEVYPNGRIKIFVNNDLVGEVTDTRYTYIPYFGTFSAVDEYTGLQAEFDWYNVRALTP